MAINYPGPYELRMFYTVQGRPHVQKLNVDASGSPSPGDSFVDIDLLQRDATTISASAWVDAYILLVDHLYNDTDASITRFEFWEYASESFDASFISALSVSENGSNTNATKPAAEAIFTFRTLEGNSMKLVFEDTTQTPGLSEEYADMGTENQDLVDYILSDDNVILARDTSMPFAFLKFHPGQNEKVFKKIYRL